MRTSVLLDENGKRKVEGAKITGILERLKALEEETRDQMDLLNDINNIVEDEPWKGKED